jgi:hypothetical protein
MAEPGWDCDAYGPGGAAVGALCHIAERYKRACPSIDVCGTVMHFKRRELWRIIQGMAAAGEPEFMILAETFTDPDMLLGGSRSAEVAGG